MGSEYTSLLYYSTSRWLSHGNLLSRTFELRQEIYIFLKEEEHKYTKHFVNGEFLVKLAYLCDIFEKLSALNLSLQGEIVPFKVDGETFSFCKRLKLWKRETNEDGGKKCFPCCNNFLPPVELISLEVRNPF
jgi:hypothetical protein